METKHDVTQGAGYLFQNDITWGEANSTGVPPDQICKQSWVMNLSLSKHWFRPSEHHHYVLDKWHLTNWLWANRRSVIYADSLSTKMTLPLPFKNIDLTSEYRRSYLYNKVCRTTSSMKRHHDWIPTDKIPNNNGWFHDVRDSVTRNSVTVSKEQSNTFKYIIFWDWLESLDQK